MRMLEARSALARKSGVKFGWNWIGPILSVLMIAGALFILWRLLRNVDFDKVVAAMLATPPHAVLWACLFVAAGYVTITFYDYFALSTIGRPDIPYRTAAFASFTSYTIGHNLGATVFTGGLVRLRIYSAWGLGIVDVAKIAFVTGLTFWLGNIVVLGIALAYAPDAAAAVTQLPAWINRSIGIGALLTIAAYVVWLLPRPRPIGRNNWQITLPDARLTFVQIGIGILDFAAGSLAFYMLMPATPVDGLRRGGGRVRLGDAAWLHQSRARQSRHLRRDHAARPAAVPDGGAAGVAADLPRLVFRRAVRGRRADAGRARAVAGADTIPRLRRCHACVEPAPCCRSHVIVACQCCGANGADAGRACNERGRAHQNMELNMNRANDALLLLARLLMAALFLPSGIAKAMNFAPFAEFAGRQGPALRRGVGLCGRGC